MVGLNQIKSCLILVFCLSLLTPLSFSTYISDSIFGPQVILSERRLLQTLKHCPTNFEFQNYTVITSQCKPPDYSPKLCCSAFKEFACPFADELNDSRNDCAIVMFSYINIIGKYPHGLFASICREGQHGLACPASPPKNSKKNGGGRNVVSGVLSTAALVLALHCV